MSVPHSPTIPGLSRYDGQPPPLTSEDIDRIGGCLLALAGSSHRRTAAEEDQSFLIELAGRISDEQFRAAIAAGGLGDRPALRALAQQATDQGGISKLLQARLAPSLTFDFSGCAQGAGQVVLGSAMLGLAVVVSISSTDSAIAIGSQGVALISAGADQMDQQC
ncbi:MAG: hypothetical protein ABI140_19665 [Jatrophihabitantaceae bacterium]